MINHPPKRIYYGWIIVAVAFVNLYVTYSVTYTFSTFLLGLESTYGWPRASMSITYSMLMFLVGLTGPISGALVDRYGPRRVIPIGNGLIAVGLLLCSQVNSLWQFYLAYGVVTALGVSLAGLVPVVTTLSQWFQVRRGTATGIALSATGLAMLSVQFVDSMIVSSGWRASYVLMSVLVAVSLPLGFLYRSKPSDMGLLPDGAAPSVKSPGQENGTDSKVPDGTTEKQWTIAMALGVGSFWLLLIGTMVSAVSNQIVIVHQLAAFVSLGFDRQFVAAAIGFGGIASWLGKMWWGYISDYIPRELAYFLGSIFMAMGMLLVAISDDSSFHWLPYVYALLIGGGYSISALKGSMTADIFQGRSFGGIFGLLHLATSVGQAFGPIFAGFVYDVTGTYSTAFFVGAVAILISAFMYILAAPRKYNLARKPAVGRR